MTNYLDSHLEAYQGQSIYEFDNQIQLNWYPQRIISLSPNRDGSLLELGVGHGVTTQIFSEHFRQKHVVLDASAAVIKNFQNKFPDCRAEIIETFFEKYNSSEKFDVIVFGFILEHVENPIEIMSYFKKFLKKDGRVFLTVPNSEVLNRRLGFHAGLLADMQQLSEHDHICGHKRYYSVKTLRQDIEEAGYKVKRFEGIYLKPLTTSQMISLNFDKKILEAMCVVGIDYPELSCGILAEIEVC